MAPPKIQTYHCLCASLLLSTTHTLSNLPFRSAPTSDTLSDSAIILPLPATPPLSTSTTGEGENGDEGGNALPAAGYTVLLGLAPDRKTTLIRRSDGFEKRILYRCTRCRLVVGYELQLPPTPLPLPLTAAAENSSMDVDVEMGGSGSGSGKGKGRDVDVDVNGGGEEGYEGKVLYILPGGVMSTDVLASGRKVGEEDVGFVGVSTGTGGRGAVAVFE